MINIKAPTGTRLELTNQYIKQVEADMHEVVAPADLDLIVSSIGLTPGFSAIFLPIPDSTLRLCKSA